MTSPFFYAVAYVWATTASVFVPAGDGPPPKHHIYYVDATEGDDQQDGLSPGQAWRTLAQVNQAELAPGDTVCFRRGSTWRGSLQPASGDAAAPIIYTAYGDGPKPTLLGSRPRDRRDDWVEVRDGIWATRALEYRRIQLLMDLSDSSWSHHQEAGAQARVERATTADGAVVRITCVKGGERSNHIQLWGPQVAIEKGTTIEFSFRARCSIPFQLPGLELLQAHDPWTRYATARLNRPLTTQWQDFAGVLTVQDSAPDARLHVSLGACLPEGSVLELQPQSLQLVEPNILDPLDVDVGNIIFDHGEKCGWKKWSPDALTQPYDYYYDGPSQRVYLCLETNPAARHQSIECALKRHVVDQSNTHHVIYDGLDVRYGAAHGFGGGSTDHITIRNCDLSYIGGGHQHTRPDGRPVRYGNAIEFWGAASNHLVEHCRIWEVYDAALTNQNRGGSIHQENIVYRHNVIWNCEYSFEYWNHPETSVTRNIQFVNNTCLFAGRVWSHSQRPDQNGSHLMFYSNTADTAGVEVKRNIFYQVTEWGSRYSGGWKTLPEMSHNLWFSEQGVMANWFGERLGTFEQYRATTGLDADSRFADPQLIVTQPGVFHLAPDSPARSLGPGGTAVGAAETAE